MSGMQDKDDRQHSDERRRPSVQELAFHHITLEEAERAYNEATPMPLPKKLEDRILRDIRSKDDEKTN